MKKVLTYVLSMVMVAALAIGGTLAYLQDEESDVNVMTMGNVNIEQLEYERVVDENGNWKPSNYTGYNYTADLMQPFTQAKPAYPAVYQDGNEKWDDRNGNQNPSGEGSHQQPWSQIGAPGSNQLFDSSVKNVVDKFVFVKNTGKSDAYYRTIVAIELPEGLDDSIIHLNQTVNSKFDWADEFYTTINNTRYLVHVATYNEVLTSGEISRPSFLQAFLDPKVTNEDCALFGDTWEILAVSQAVQTAGFEDAEQALNTAFGEVTAKKVAEWFGETKVPAVTKDPEELQDLLNEKQDVILSDDAKVEGNQSNAYGKTAINVYAGQTFDGAGNTLSAHGANDTWDSAINITGGTIKNLTIDSGFRGIFINHNSTAENCGPVVLENVVIDGTVYTISCDQGTNQGLTAINSTFNGWTSYADTLGKATFIDCNFGKGSGYATLVPYGESEFINCHFSEGYEFHMCEAPSIILDNCTVNGVKITASNLNDFIPECSDCANTDIASIVTVK